MVRGNEASRHRPRQTLQNDRRLGESRLRSSTTSSQGANEHSIIFLRCIKEVLDVEGKYDQFLGIMRSVRHEHVNDYDVIERVEEVFAGHNDLILGFNMFLPENGVIPFTGTEDEKQSALLRLDEMMARQRLLMVCNQPDQGTEDDTHRSQETRRLSVSESDPERNSERGSAGRYGSAFSYAARVKELYPDPEIFRKFTSILSRYRGSRLSLDEVNAAIAELFEGHDDLIHGFAIFLPGSGIQGDQDDTSGRHRNYLENHDLIREEAARDSDSDRPDEDNVPDRDRKRTQKRSLRGRKAAGPATTRGLQKTLSLCEKFQQQVPVRVCRKLWRSLFGFISGRFPIDAVRITASKLFGESNQDLLQDFNTVVSEFQNLKIIFSEALKKMDIRLEDVETKAQKKARELKARRHVKSLNDCHINTPWRFNREGLSISAWNVHMSVDRDLLRQKKLNQQNKDYLKAISEYDVSTWEECSPSYKIIPGEFPKMLATNVLPITKQVVNDEVVSITKGSEDYSFKFMRKNLYEDHLFRCEEDQFELDILLENAGSLYRRIQEVFNYCEKNKDFRDFENLSKNLEPYHKRAIERIYGEHGTDFLEQILKDPKKSIPIFIVRLKDKIQEWEHFRAGTNKVWDEMYAKNQPRALDHRSGPFKLEEDITLGRRGMISEINELQAGKEADDNAVVARMSHGNEFCFDPHLSFEFSDPSIHREVKFLLSFSARMLCPTKEGKDLVMGLWDELFEPFLGISSVPEASPVDDHMELEDQMQEDEGAAHAEEGMPSEAGDLEDRGHEAQQLSLSHAIAAPMESTDKPDQAVDVEGHKLDATADEPMEPEAVADVEAAVISAKDGSSAVEAEADLVGNPSAGNREAMGETLLEERTGELVGGNISNDGIAAGKLDSDQKVQLVEALPLEVSTQLAAAENAMLASSAVEESTKLSEGRDITEPALDVVEGMDEAAVGIPLPRQGTGQGQEAENGKQAAIWPVAVETSQPAVHTGQRDPDEMAGDFIKEGPSEQLAGSPDGLHLQATVDVKVEEEEQGEHSQVVVTTEDVKDALPAPPTDPSAVIVVVEQQALPVETTKDNEGAATEDAKETQAVGVAEDGENMEEEEEAVPDDGGDSLLKRDRSPAADLEDDGHEKKRNKRGGFKAVSRPFSSRGGKSRGGKKGGRNGRGGRKAAGLVKREKSSERGLEDSLNEEQSPQVKEEEEEEMQENEREDGGSEEMRDAEEGAGKLDARKEWVPYRDMLERYKAFMPLAVPLPAPTEGRVAAEEHVFYCNDVVYIVFRLHQLLYSRILTAKQLSENPLDPNFEVVVRMPAEERFKIFKELLLSLLKGSLDITAYEEGCRKALGNHSFVTLTLDKVLYKLVKQLQRTMTDSLAQKLIKLRAYSLSQGRGQVVDATYRANAELLTEGESLFRLVRRGRDGEAGQLSIQLLDAGDGSEEIAAAASRDGPRGDFQKFYEDVEGVVRLPHYVALNRNVTLAGGKLKQKPGGVFDNLLVRNGLGLSYMIGSKSFYIHGTEDFFLRESSRALFRRTSGEKRADPHSDRVKAIKALRLRSWVDKSLAAAAAAAARSASSE